MFPSILQKWECESDDCREKKFLYDFWPYFYVFFCFLWKISRFPLFSEKKGSSVSIKGFAAKFIQYFCVFKKQNAKRKRLHFENVKRDNDKYQWVWWESGWSYFTFSDDDTVYDEEFEKSTLLVKHPMVKIFLKPVVDMLNIREVRDLDSSDV